MDDIAKTLDEALFVIERRSEALGMPWVDWPENFDEHFDDVIRHVRAASRHRQRLDVCPFDPLTADFGIFNDYEVIQMFNPSTAAALEDVGKRITQSTGFECLYDTIQHTISEHPRFMYEQDIYPRPPENTVAHVTWKTWWCPQLKLAFYIESPFLLPPSEHWLYVDILPRGTYARKHTEFTVIRERIRIDKNIMMFEVPRDYIEWNEERRQTFVSEIISHYTNKMPFVGGAAKNPSS